jgi:hypothetical protein
MRYGTADTLPAGQLREIAVAASADPRTVAEVLRGRPLTTMVRLRVARVLDAQGIPRPTPHNPNPYPQPKAV